MCQDASPSSNCFRLPSSSALLAVVAGVALLGVVFLSVKLTLVHMHISYARSHVDVFWDLVERSPGKSSAEIAGHIKYILEYYPPDTILKSNSDISQIVEASRLRAAIELVKLLKRDSVEDYGNSPVRWVKKIIGANVDYTFPSTAE